MVMPAQHTAHREPGRLLQMDDRRNGHHTQIPNDLIDDISLGMHARRIYELIRRRDWNGEGWTFTIAELAEAVPCSERTIYTALETLRERGLVRWEGIARRPKRYFTALPGPVEPAPRADRTCKRCRSTSSPTCTTCRSNLQEMQIEPAPRADPPPTPPLYAESKTIKDDQRGGDVAHAREEAPAPCDTDRQTEQATEETPAFDIAGAIGDALGCDVLGETVRRQWTQIVAPVLGDLPADEQQRFAAWLVSNGWWRRETVHLLAPKLRGEAETWLIAAKPTTKKTSRWRGSQMRRGPTSGSEAAQEAMATLPRVAVLCQCRCLVGYPGREHAYGCGLDGPVTLDNYVDYVTGERHVRGET